MTGIALPADMSESLWQACVLRLVKLYGWQCYHTHDSRRSESGWPDLVLVHPSRHRCLFVELKTNRGRTTSAQRVWLRMLRACRLEVAVLRPRDLPVLVEVLGPKNRPLNQSDQECMS